MEIPGTGFRLQSSDVAKVALIIYLSRVLSQSQGGELNNFRFVTIRLILPVAAVCLLIITENLSTALMIFGISILL
ncbi:MAG: FtsW/RodA/SpoVE family cell cycle protein, partial [Bacteroidales bacterium]|nr:FtsW/RodA/SpoVE family cell cycle protein [Bacteroidales bacterium]